MNHRSDLFAFTVAVTLFSVASSAFAGKGTELKPMLAKPGKATFELKAASAGKLDKPWAVAKGDWQIAEGGIVGKEKASDQHAAVLTLGEPNRDSIIRFSFKLDGATGFNLSFNHAKGHLFRIGVSDTGLALNLDKDKKDPASKVVSLGKAEGKFERGKWYTMQVEIKGTKVFVQTDNGIKLDVSHAALDVDKTGYRFVMRKESLLLSDVKVWQVE